MIATNVIVITNNIKNLCKYAKKNKKKINFDAAHCFDPLHKKEGILNFGDASILSFQATKVFNTCEGGAVIFKKKKDLEAAKTIINIGYNYNKKNSKPSFGTNAKMSELNAAWGLALLENLSKILNKKKIAYQYYIENLNNKKVEIINKKFKNNFNYVPILFNSKNKRDLVFNRLKNKKIYARKYFYPSLNTLKHLKYKKMPISEDVCSRILCLPIYEDIIKKNIIKISKIVNHYG